MCPMEVNTFPFRLDEHTRAFVGELVSAMSRNGAKIQSLMQGQCALLFDKSIPGALDAQMSFGNDGITLSYSLMAIAKIDEPTRSWLNKFHDYLVKQKKSTLTPVLPRCLAQVKISREGVIQYFLTYMVQYPDESIAQETPQGKLYATEGVGAIKATATKPAGDQW